MLFSEVDTAMAQKNSSYVCLKVKLKVKACRIFDRRKIMIFLADLRNFVICKDHSHENYAVSLIYLTVHYKCYK